MKLPKQFPSISRIITENILLRRFKNLGLSSQKNSRFNKFYTYFSIFLSLIVVVVLAILTGFVIFNFSQNFIKFQTSIVQRQQIQGKINFWRSISDKYAGYPDAYFNIASLYFRLENFSESRRYLNKTLILNPDYIDAKKLDLALKNKGY